MPASTQWRVLDKVVVRPKTRCWHWTAARDKDGYGVIAVQRPHRTVRAHRFSYEAFVGPIPVGALVMHSCDNPGCVNPDHLAVGTHTDNVHDCRRKGRLADTRGQKHGFSKLTDAQAREILDSRGTQWEIAKKFGVSQQTVSGIKLRRTWRHV